MHRSLSWRHLAEKSRVSEVRCDLTVLAVSGVRAAGRPRANCKRTRLVTAWNEMFLVSDRIASCAGPKGQILEQGFHSSILVNRNGREALGLAKMLKLEDDVQGANIEASARRHLLHRGRVQLAPAAHHVLVYGPALMAEPLWPRGRQSDESVAAFTSRRGSRSLARHLGPRQVLGQSQSSALCQALGRSYLQRSARWQSRSPSRDLCRQCTGMFRPHP